MPVGKLKNKRYNKSQSEIKPETKKERKMQSIDADIRNNNLKRIYLLYGEEDYLKKQYRDKLREAIADKDDSMNYSYYEGKQTDAAEIVDVANTLPFFAERRLILLENTGFFKEGNELLTEYFKDPAQDTYFVFVEAEVDKRNRFYKTVKENGKIVEFKQQDEALLRKWILGRLKKENKQISEGALQLFLTKTGQDMTIISTELEKLVCYTLEKDSILPEDVEAVCTARIQNKIFEMVDAIGNKNQKKAMDLYYDLLILREAPMKILALLSRQFLILLQIKEISGMDKNSIAGKIGIPPFAVQKNQTQAKQFKTARLKEALEDCAEYEEAFKTGRLNERLCVELLIVKYSSIEKESE